MEPQDSEPIGDYGYDLAHEDVRPTRAPEPPHPDQPGGGAVHRTPDLAEDYAYDEAHDF